MKNMLRVLSGLVIVLALLMTLSVFTASAQGPTGTATPTPAQAPAAPGTNLDNPSAAATIGSAVSAVPANSATWYKFDYTTNGNTFPRPQMTIRMINGVTSGLGLEVWSNERINDQFNQGNDTPVGRAVQEVLPGCTTTLPDGTTARCTTNDLVWTGGFGADGTYFARVVNNTNNPIAPQLIFSGDGLVLCSANPNPPMNAPQVDNSQGYAIIECTTAVATPAAAGGQAAPTTAATTAPAATSTPAATSAPTSAPTTAATTAPTTAATSAPTSAATSSAPSAATPAGTQTPAAAPTTTSGTPGASAPSAVTGLAVAQNSTLGPILTDDAGRTVYAFVQDTSTTSNCNGTCAQNWPPLAASASATPTAGNGVTASMIGTINRSDGSTQLTYNGHPLYYFAKDTNPGDTTGQGVSGNWWTLKPDGTLNQGAGAGAAMTPAASGTEMSATPAASATP